MVPRTHGYPILIKSISYKETDKSYEKKPDRFYGHKWYCVIYGSVEMVVEGREIVIHPEESVLIPPNTPRRTRALKTMVGYICLYLENRGISLEPIEGRAVPLSEPQTENIRELLKELKSPVNRPDSMHYIYALVINLLISQLRSASLPRGSLRPHSFLNHEYKKGIVEKTDRFILAHLGERLTRDQLAAALNLSPSHLGRLYRQTTGITLVDRIAKARVERACSLLLDGRTSITEIAEQVGYGSYSHFSQVFKSRTGVTPSIYRKTHGNAYGSRGRA